MIDLIFDRCVDLLVLGAGALGMTYKEINVWIFVVLWPALTLALAAAILRLRRRLRDLEGKLAARR